MELHLYNTLSGKKEKFSPLGPSKVGLYNCGPTVYDHVHVGNLRAYVFADTLRRVLEWNGYEVRQVMNITDVGHLSGDGDDGEDKMTKALKREGKPMTMEAMREIGTIYTNAFLEDMEALGIKRPHELPRASDHISEDIEMVTLLLAKGFAYETSDGIYFDISKYPDYGKLGNIERAGQEAGARVAVNSEKRHPADFSIWKFNDSLGWETPFGKGFPGWHLECSAMSRKYLGQPFDIHTGGIDHIPVHHNNEIAQSEAAYEVPLARYWMHNAFLNLSGEKMAKSAGGFITLRTIKDRGIHPLALRYYFLGAHYRSPLDFSFEVVEAAQASYYKLLILFAACKDGTGTVAKPDLSPANDDLNTAEILAGVWTTLKDSSLSADEKRSYVLEADRMLGLDIENQAARLQEEMSAVPDEIRRLAADREKARISKDWKTADGLRDKIVEAGYTIQDTEAGPIILRKL